MIITIMGLRIDLPHLLLLIGWLLVILLSIVEHMRKHRARLRAMARIKAMRERPDERRE